MQIEVSQLSDEVVVIAVADGSGEQDRGDARPRIVMIDLQARESGWRRRACRAHQRRT